MTYDEMMIEIKRLKENAYGKEMPTKISEKEYTAVKLNNIRAVIVDEHKNIVPFDQKYIESKPDRDFSGFNFDIILTYTKSYKCVIENTLEGWKKETNQ